LGFVDDFIHYNCLQIKMAYAGKDSFDSYSNGGLNGLNGGSGFDAAWSAHADIVVQSTTKFKGSKAITNSNLAASRTAYRTFSAQSSGSAYIAIRRQTGNMGANGGIEIYSGGSWITTPIALTTAAGNTGLLYYSGGWNKYSDYTADSWIIVNLEWDYANHPNKFRIRAKTGTTWGAFTAWVDAYAGFSSLDKFAFNFPNGDELYFDELDFNDPSIVEANHSNFFALF
jgi:hypothetical protein